MSDPTPPVLASARLPSAAPCAPAPPLAIALVDAPAAPTFAPAPAVPADCGGIYPHLERPRYRSLDAWRGLACLMLMLVHAGFSYKSADTPLERTRHPLAWAVLAGIGKLSVGVPMFFVISGYCVSASSDSSRRRARAGPDFFLRRFRRIFPPYWATLGVTLVLYFVGVRLFPQATAPLGGWRDGAIPTLGGLSPSQWVGNGTLTEMWRHHLLGGGPSLILPPTWTLCYEEQFYAVCGLLLVIVPRRFFAGALLVSLITAGVYLATLITPRVHVSGLFVDGRWLMFGQGVLLYHCLNYQGRRGQVASAAVMAAGVLAATAVYKLPAFTRARADALDIAYSLRVSGVFALLLMALHRFDARIARAKPLLPFVLCGQMCYSLYLIHWPLAKLIQCGLYHAGVRGFVPTVLVTVPMVSVAAVGSAWAFYHLVEKRFINTRRTVNAC